MSDKTAWPQVPVVSNSVARCWVVLVVGQSNAGTADLAYMPTTSDLRLLKYQPSDGVTALSELEVNLPSQFCRELLPLIPPGDTVMMVKAAIGSTSLTEYTATVDGASVTCSWDPANTTATVNLYDRAITWAEGALATTAHGAPFLAAILFSGFEGDTPYMTEATFTSKVITMLQGFRTALTASTTPIVVGSMVPEYMDLRGQTYTAEVSAAIAKLPGASGMSLCAGFYGPRGFTKPTETIHFSALGQIERGKLAIDAYKRAQRSWSTIDPMAPPNVSIVREPGRAIMYWGPVTGRVSSLTAEFSKDGGATWTAGTIDNDSRLFATFPLWPWENVQGRVRATNSTAAHQTDSEYAYTNTLVAVEAVPSGVTIYELTAAGSASISPANTGAGTLFAAVTLPASGGSYTVNARNAGSTRQFYLSAVQATPTDFASANTSFGALTAAFANPKGVAGLHVNAATLSADGVTITGYRDLNSAVTGTTTTGAIDMSTLVASASGGTTFHGAVLFAGAACDATEVARLKRIIANRYGKSLQNVTS